MSIYHWKLGDIALARVCKKVYAKVRVVKNEDGLFHDDKVLGIASNEDGGMTTTEELCYHVEIIRSGQRLWLPYTCLHLAERSRPFYGVDKVSPPKPVAPSTPKKRKIKEDHTLPLQVKLSLKEPDLNTTYDIDHVPLQQCKSENPFKAFVRRGKDMLFDQFYYMLEKDAGRNEDVLDYLMNVDASTEDKFETVIKNLVTEKEIENYLHQCWRYNFVYMQSGQPDNANGSDGSNPSSPSKGAVTVHAPWCLVCGKTAGRLLDCCSCPAAYHLACRREWLVFIIHRRNPQKATRTTFVEKILSSTRTICTKRKNTDTTDLCPSCMWGPKVGYNDVVWHKLGPCAWWPARVLPPGSTPACLLSRSHTKHQWPLRYYGTLNYSWGDASRMCLFLPTHSAALQAPDATRRRAVLDACDDYITVYLT